MADDTSAIAAQLMADLQRDLGLTKEQAAGVVGNLMHESGGFGSLQEISPLVPGSKGGYGYAQWTGPRRTAFESYVANNGLDPTSYEANYGFLKNELQTDPYERKQFMTVKSAQTAEEAARLISENYLRPGIPHMPARVAFANQALGYAPKMAPTPAMKAIQQALLPEIAPPGASKANKVGNMPDFYEMGQPNAWWAAGAKGAKDDVPGIMRPAQPKGGNLLTAAIGGIGNIANYAGQQAAPIMQSAQAASQNAMPSIMKAALGSVAARTALIDPAIKNIMTGNRSGALGMPPPATGFGSKGYSTIMAPGGVKKLDNASGVWVGQPVSYGSGGFSDSGSSGGAHGGSDRDKHPGVSYNNGRRY
jgi:hypothetical protein